MGLIYKAVNIINNKVYIGLTKGTLDKRVKEHIYESNKRCKYVFHKAIRKYGKENFEFSIIEYCQNRLLNIREMYWIKYYNSHNRMYGYNMTEGGANQDSPWNKAVLCELDILDMFNSGITAYKIAKILKTGVPRVTSVLKKNNIIYGVEKLKTDKLLEQLIIDLYKLGYSSVTISKYFNLNKSTVLHILKRNNIISRTTKETRELERNLPTLI